MLPVASKTSSPPRPQHRPLREPSPAERISGKLVAVINGLASQYRKLYSCDCPAGQAQAAQQLIRSETPARRSEEDVSRQMRDAKEWLNTLYSDLPKRKLEPASFEEVCASVSQLAALATHLGKHEDVEALSSDKRVLISEATTLMVHAPYLVFSLVSEANVGVDDKTTFLVNLRGKLSQTFTGILPLLMPVWQTFPVITLNLSANRLITLDPNIARTFPHTTTLYLSNNRFVLVPFPALAPMHSLDLLDMRGQALDEYQDWGCALFEILFDGMPPDDESTAI